MSDSGAKTSGSRKRVSFLMPYIDFCFMLIIIFVGMLSIAYFEPLGLVDIQTKHADTINKSEGQYEVKPRGIQEQNYGPGEQQKNQEVLPLSGASAVGSATGADQKELERLRKLLSQYHKQIAAANITPGKGATGAEVADLQRLKELEAELAAKIKEIEALKAIQAELLEKIAELQKMKTATTGPANVRLGPQGTGVDEKGNHIYIDLRGREGK